MELQIGAAKINKYAMAESGDTLEFIERPSGGISVVLADGQMSGKSAKAISNMVVRKVVSLLAEGVRDGAAARAASDYLFHEKKGRVQASLNILSVDLASKTLVITRNNPSPVFLFYENQLEIHNEISNPVGIYRNTRPVITETPLVIGLIVYVFSDGVPNAGVSVGKSLDLPGLILELSQDHEQSAQQLADRLLHAALELDNFRPRDDVSVLVLRVNELPGDGVRRANIRIPISV